MAQYQITYGPTLVPAPGVGDPWSNVWLMHTEPLYVFEMNSALPPSASISMLAVTLNKGSRNKAFSFVMLILNPFHPDNETTKWQCLQIRRSPRVSSSNQRPRWLLEISSYHDHLQKPQKKRVLQRKHWVKGRAVIKRSSSDRCGRHTKQKGQSLLPENQFETSLLGQTRTFREFHRCSVARLFFETWIFC